MTKNLDLKIFSLVFAIILWIFATTGKKGEIGIIVPVELKNIPQNLVVIDFDPASVDMKISGPKSMLRSILDRDLKLSVNLGNFKREGVYRYRVTGLEVNLPRGVMVKGIKPRMIEIELDRLVKKEVPVVPKTSGKPAEFYKVSSVKVTPGHVVMEGPKRYVSKVKNLETQPVSVSGRSSSFTSTVSVVEGDLPHTTIDPERVEVSVFIEPVVGEKTFTIPISYPEGVKLSLRPSKVNVTLKGPLYLLSNLKKDAIKAIITLNPKRTRGYATVSVVLKDALEGSVELKKTYPSKVRYRILR